MSLSRAPPSERQSNLTDSDSAPTGRLDAQEYPQAYNAQAVICADGAQLILATNPVAITADAPTSPQLSCGRWSWGPLIWKMSVDQKM